MCRSDVFRKIRFSDSGSVAADGGIYIDWRAEAADPEDTLLWDNLASKAAVTKAALLGFLPRTIPIGNAGRSVRTSRYILQRTRYTPRDMAVLFRGLQDKAQGSQLTGAVVKSAVDHFASNHLLQEMMGEAHGLLPPAAVERMGQALAQLPRRHFDRDQLITAMRQANMPSDISVDLFGEYLFLQGGIGNHRPDSQYVQFYHRRNAYGFSPSGPWVLHYGLMDALNVPWGGR